MGKLKKSDLEKLLKAKDVSEFARFWEGRDLIVKDYGRHVVWDKAGIDADETVKKIPSANEEELRAFMTMLIREDHFCDGRFKERLKEGWPQKIVERLMKFAE